MVEVEARPFQASYLSVHLENLFLPEPPHKPYRKQIPDGLFPGNFNIIFADSLLKLATLVQNIRQGEFKFPAVILENIFGETGIPYNGTLAG